MTQCRELLTLLCLVTCGCASVPHESEPGATASMSRVSDQQARAPSLPQVTGQPRIQQVAFDVDAQEREVARGGMPDDVLSIDGSRATSPRPPRPPRMEGVMSVSSQRRRSASEPVERQLNLATALQMAGGQSPQIALAVARYREAYARYQAAQTLWLPSIRAGLSYNHHDGNLQGSRGDIVDISRSSLQSGLGVQAVGAGTTPVPGVVMQFHTSDAVFAPNIAAHAASAQRAGMRTTTNDTLLETALAYLELLRSYQALRIAEATLEDVQELEELTSTFARTGQGSQADADRVRTHLVRRTNDVSQATEATRVAAARLAEVLSTDPSVPIVPEEPAVVPVDLTPQAPVNELVATGLANRPELAEAQYLVCEAVYRYRREKYAPLLPSVLLGISETGFGGGLGSELDDFRHRFDYDAVAYWELRNLGFGEMARRDETRASYDRARAAQARLMDRVAREVVEAQAQVEARRTQIATAESGIASAEDAYRRDLARIREGAGLPIEALQSVQALDEARREYLRAVIDYNAAQFSLQRALGWPIR